MSNIVNEYVRLTEEYVVIEDIPESGIIAKAGDIVIAKGRSYYSLEGKFICDKESYFGKMNIDNIHFKQKGIK